MVSCYRVRVVRKVDDCSNLELKIAVLFRSKKSCKLTKRKKRQYSTCSKFNCK